MKVWLHCHIHLSFWDLHSWRVEAHVVDSTAGWMDPAVTQPLSQSLVGYVEADNQVELIQTVQGLGLRQRPRKTYTESSGMKENVSVIFLSATFKTVMCVSLLSSHHH